MDGKPLFSATIYSQTERKGTMTNEQGEFQIELEEGLHHLTVSHVGFQSLDTSLRLPVTLEAVFLLDPIVIEGNEIIITANRNNLVESNKMGEIKISHEELNILPSLLGEADPVKLLQLTPGIQKGSEAGSGFYVRGGNIDQNLILLNNSPVYNPGHLLGFFSV
ncbi:MAG: carboxypeptidase-like regulatory domain-containing protein, partial [Bacteroidota bacterium]